jgi:hypothetical protein
MKKCLVCICCVAFCFACTPADKKIPPDILPIDTMKVLIWEMTQAGEYAGYLRERDTTIKSLNTAYFSAVLKLHHLEKNKFYTSFHFYQAHPTINKILMDSVSAYSSRQRTEAYKILE